MNTDSRTSTVRLRAECQDCEPTWNTDYGYWEKVSCEAVDEAIVKAWAWRHVYDKKAEQGGTKGHKLVFSQVCRVAINVEHLNPKVLQRLGFTTAETP